MPDQTPKSKEKDLRSAERAVDRAFTTGKADRAAITRSAQLDAAEAVAMAGIAMESDEAADEAARLAVIASSMGNRDRAKAARAKEREAHAQAKKDHQAATKSAKQAYDAIKFSDPTKLGFMRVVQVIFFLHIASTLASLIFTSRDTIVYSSVTIIDWIMVVLETVAFFFFVYRYKLGRPLTIAIGAIGLASRVIFGIASGTMTVLSTLSNSAFYIFLILYFVFSDRVKAVLVNDLSSEKGADDTDELVIDRRSWPFYRNLIIYFVIFSVLGHWMEAGMCQFIRLGWVQGEYDPSNTMLWRDWLYPYPMEGAAVVLIALFLYPFYTWLKRKFENRFVPYVISFFSNALLCTLIEFAGGLMFNAQLQNWDYTNMPFNFMGQVCLQNTMAFGVAASVITWFVYPALERWIARRPPAAMNIACIVIAIAGGILFSLYAISPPDGIDLGKEETLTAAEEERSSLAYSVGAVEGTYEHLQKTLEESKALPKDERKVLEEDLVALKLNIDKLMADVKSYDTSSSSGSASSAESSGSAGSTSSAESSNSASGSQALDNAA